MNLTLPKFLTDLLLVIYGLYNFSARYFKEVFMPPYEFKETFRQFFEIGNKSLGLVSLTGFIVGFVLALQSIPMLTKFGAVSLIPTMISISIVREIGPVIIGLICAGKIGSGIGAELGSMKVTEQIDAMEVSATNPFKFLVVTRITATTLMIPLLIIYADTIALIGGFFALNIFSGQSPQLYFSSVFSALTFSDILPATVKTFFFGFAIGLVGCYQGYNASRGTESVGIAANVSVVHSSLLVIIIDMITVQVTTILF
ncbi:MAG: ABC transporter permease [Ignavibacteria bacterium]|jgi:phospholipid/cholesterol/gamma-HCH transport system permease protein|nr:ABC transporter permease [Ignavibacteria bacterium]